MIICLHHNAQTCFSSKSRETEDVANNIYYSWECLWHPFLQSRDITIEKPFFFVVWNERPVMAVMAGKKKASATEVSQLGTRWPGCRGCCHSSSVIIQGWQGIIYIYIIYLIYIYIYFYMTNYKHNAWVFSSVSKEIDQRYQSLAIIYPPPKWHRPWQGLCYLRETPSIPRVSSCGPSEIKAQYVLPFTSWTVLHSFLHHVWLRTPTLSS